MFTGVSLVRAAVLAAALSATAGAAQDADQEYRLKAAFVYQFSQFVDWPEAAWVNLKDVELCVSGAEALQRELERLVKGESLRGRPYVVRALGRDDAVASCQVLVVTARSKDDVTELLRDTVGRPILTIGETDRFLDDGGIIRLTLDQRRVRFDVSAAEARRAGLRISPQLLNLARSIRGGPS
jgi:hypothetical protein